MTLNTTDALFALLIERGNRAYGLSQVSQLEHALQAAALAQQDGLGDTLTVAALFHDIGHLLPEGDMDMAASGIDDRHERAGARILAPIFGATVSEPVRLHVFAKRYLCTVEPAYGERLSADSRLSLSLQGGPLSASEIAAFAAEEFFCGAVALRRLDDGAKMPHRAVPGLDRYYPIATTLAATWGRSRPHSSAP